MPVPLETIHRDLTNADIAQKGAFEKLRDFSHGAIREDITGALSGAIKRKRSHSKTELEALQAVHAHPFHAMVHVNTELRNGSIQENLVLYAHERTITTLAFDGVVVLAWTHPAVQLALTENIDEACDVDDPRYNIIEITPIARARFQKVLPDIVGIYDPGGSVGKLGEKKPQTGLKAVKLDMTAEQVKAFVSRMKGVLYVTGAPGSGKTTVALQRMRFLFDAGDQPSEVEHVPERSRVFLANPNLVEHSKALLEKQLEIPPSIVSLVGNFIEEYLDDAWRHKNEAKRLPYPIKEFLPRRGREAFFSTCTVDDLKSCWKIYEDQIVERLAAVGHAHWFADFSGNSGLVAKLDDLKNKILEFAKHQSEKRRSFDPFFSKVRMDTLYESCSLEYENIRGDLLRSDLEKFDELFSKWLFNVYDPLDGIAAYFGSKKHEGALRVRRGTAARIEEKSVIDQIFSDFSDRRYRREEMSWLAWLLRFALPSESNPQNRFRDIPRAESPLLNKYGPWSHVVIDEAQDLSVTEASLISSFVIHNGALTIAADFRQVVSPVHGMENPNAFKIGCHLVSQTDDLKLFPFTKNKRQSSQIGNFLRGFYEKAFGELPPFMANEDMNGPKPQLRLMPSVEFGNTIKNAWNIFKKANFGGTVALLQVNEDVDEMIQYREILQKGQVPLAPLWASDDSEGRLITSSVERVKGLEYDACFIIGMEEAENMEMNFNRNRVYVALSRPTQRLFMLCKHFPALLHGIRTDLFEVIDAR